MFSLHTDVCAARSGRARAHRFSAAIRAGLLGAAITVALALIPASAAQAAGPGSWTQEQVNAGIEKGVAYLATQQNLDGSFGSDDVAETGIALAAFGVDAAGNFSNLSAAYQTDVKNAIKYLLTNQDTTHGGPPDYFGSWSSFGSTQTYSTGLALLGLSFFKTVEPGVETAIENGRTFLSGPDFEGPANTSCESKDGSASSTYCGGWNYEASYGRSDESNSGYALTGLEVTGGIPAGLVADDINWQHHVQEISGNPFAGRNDGGADYQPAGGGFCEFGTDIGGFCSNANDSGSNLFGYADDGVAKTDSHVAASIKFAEDVLSAYELMKTSAGVGGLAMIAHSGASEDGSCTPNEAGCDWFTSGDGGFHYSLFALTKGLGSYVAASLSEASNWYAKVVDLLLSQQNENGSWPQDARDDFSTVFATGLAVAALGKVAVVKAATCGKTTIGKTLDPLVANLKRVNKCVLPVNAAVSELTAYLSPTSFKGQELIKGIIYADSKGKPGARLGVTEQITFKSTEAANWYPLKFASPVKVAAGTIWIGLITGNSGKVAGERYDSVAGIEDYNTNNYLAGASNPFGSFKTTKEEMSLYATYLPEAGSTG